MENIPEILKDFKDAYDAMDYQRIASLFAEQVKFKGTAEKEYRQALRADIAEYFEEIGKTRKSQELGIEYVGDCEDPIFAWAVFKSVAKDGNVNEDKPVAFEIRLDETGKISEFSSRPRTQVSISTGLDPKDMPPEWEYGDETLEPGPGNHDRDPCIDGPN